MTSSQHLAGHLPFSHALVPQQQFRDFPLMTRLLTDAPLNDLWDMDTQRLPAPLAKLRRKARAFADQYLIPIAAQEDLAPHSAPGELSPRLQELLVEAGKQGWLSYFLPAPLGSLPFGNARYPLIWSCSLVVEEFSRACGGLMLLLSAHHLGCMPLLLCGQPNMILGPLRKIYRDNQRGRPHIAAFAITEPQAGSDVEESHGAALYQPGVTATPVEGGYKLNGTKRFISGGDIAKSLTVFAALKGEDMSSWTCFYIDDADKKVTRARNELKMGMRASGAAELEFNDVFVPNKHIVGGLRKGWVLNRATLNSSRIPVASMAVGFARAATEQAVMFARNYQLNGKALINYQEVQMQLATMVAETRAIRSLIWQEARHSWSPRQLNAALCKFQATDRAQVVCEMAMDLMGDHAALHENSIDKTFRDLRLARIFEGTNQINRLALIEDWQGQLLDTNNPLIGV